MEAMQEDEPPTKRGKKKMLKQMRKTQVLSLVQPLHEGYLTKRGGRIKNWKQRWCILTPVALYYFINPKARTKARGVVAFYGGATVLRLKMKKRRFGFAIETPQRTWRFAASSKVTKKSWMTNLNNVLGPSGASSSPRNNKIANNNTHNNIRGDLGSLGTLDSLPTELRLVILSFLTIQELWVTFTVSKNWYLTASDNSLWRSFYHTLIPLNAKIEEPSRGQGWKDFCTATLPLMRLNVGIGDFEKIVQDDGEFIVRYRGDNKLYRMKEIRGSTRQSPWFDYDLAEVKQVVLDRKPRPFLVKHHFFFVKEHSDDNYYDKKLCLVVDYTVKDLLTIQMKITKFSYEAAIFYAAEVLLGLDSLHEQGHSAGSEFKPEEIRLTEQGHVLLDLGPPFQDHSRYSGAFGSVEYFAPEVVKGNDVGPYSDFWCLGCLIFEMLTGLPPFYSQDIQKMLAAILSGELTYPADMAPVAVAFLKMLLDKDPTTRLQDSEAVKMHPFFESIDWDMLRAQQIPPPEEIKPFLQKPRPRAPSLHD